MRFRIISIKKLCEIIVSFFSFCNVMSVKEFYKITDCVMIGVICVIGEMFGRVVKS